MGYNFLTSSEDALGSAAWLAGSVPSMIFNAVDENLGTNWTNAVKYSTAGMQMRGLREIGRVLKNDAEERKTELKQLPKGYNGLLDFAEKRSQWRNGKFTIIICGYSLRRW